MLIWSVKRKSKMSDYYSGYSRSPTPNQHGRHHHNRHNYHHNSHHQNYSDNQSNPHSRNQSNPDPQPSDDSHVFLITQKRRLPLESSPFAYFFIIGISIFIQIAYFNDLKYNLLRPAENELPLAFKINSYFDYIPTFNWMLDYSDHPKEVLLASFLIFLIYRIFCSTSRSPFSSFLISIMILLDETTYCLIIANPSFCAQLILMSICIINCQKLLVLHAFSKSWITYAVLSLLIAFFATFISIEAFTIFIPIIVSIVLLSKSSGKKSQLSFCSRIFKVIIASLFLVALCSICLGIVFITFLLGPPKFVVNETNLSILITEFLNNNHNISFLFILPVALILFFFTDIEFSWLLSFIGCLIFTLMSSFSSVVNDLEVQIALVIYYYLLCCGFVLTNPQVSSVSAVILIFYLAIVIYFYKYPI